MNLLLFVCQKKPWVYLCFEIPPSRIWNSCVTYFQYFKDTNSTVFWLSLFLRHLLLFSYLFLCIQCVFFSDLRFFSLPLLFSNLITVCFDVFSGSLWFACSLTDFRLWIYHLHLWDLLAASNF